MVSSARASKLICEKICLFTEVPKELWIQFSSKEEYQEKETEFFHQIDNSPGKDAVVIYLKKERAMKRLPSRQRVSIDSLNISEMYQTFGRENVKILEKSIEKM